MWHVPPQPKKKETIVAQISPQVISLAFGQTFFNLRFGEMIFQTVGLLFVVTCWALLSFVNVCSFPSSDLVGTWPIVFVTRFAV